MASDTTAVKVAAVGDIFPGDHYFSMGHGMMSRTAARQHQQTFAGIAELLKAADIAIGNLEGPLSDSTHYRSSVQASSFRGLPAFSRALQEGHFTHVNIANNHVMQHGERAFESTVDVLRASGIGIVGQRGTAGAICQPVIHHTGSKTVCLLGYSTVADPYSATPRYASFQEADDVCAEIATAARSYDYVVVSCHAGEEGLRQVSQSVMALYHRFVDAGATCVLGHHSHVFQPVEVYRDAVIAYSLGNFVFDLFWDENTVMSAILTVELGTPTHRLHPTEFHRDYTVRSMPEDRQQQFFDRLKAAMKELGASSPAEYQQLFRDYEKRNQRDKYSYFWANIHRGSTQKKLRFLLEKMTSRL